MKQPRRAAAIVPLLRPREATAFLAALTSGYQRSRQAAAAAWTVSEQRARGAVARDLRQLISDEHVAGRCPGIGEPQARSSYVAARSGRREAGEDREAAG